MFSKFDLKITIEFNFLKTDFSNVELDLSIAIYAPHIKPDFQTTHVHINCIINSINP